MKKAADYIFSHTEEIIDLWERRVKEKLEASKSTPSLALRNQLPHVLKDVAEIMARYEDLQEVENHEKFGEIIVNSIDHGRHRATSVKYDVEQIMEEFIVLHRVITEKLREQECYTTEVGILLKYTLETAMLKSAGSFNNSLQNMREKLVGTLAHDIRNPISAAYLALDMLRYEDGPERLEKVRNMATKSLQHSIKLIEGLMDTISVKAGEGISFDFEEIDLMKDVKWVFNEATEIFKNEVILESDREEVRGIFDGAAIRRILENLVTNAVKYGSKNTPIRIIMESSDKEVTISVHNEGNPIPQENRDDIFKFLNSSQEFKSGHLKSWGMGLSLVKIVAEAHGGCVKVNSSKEEGTYFKVTLEKHANMPGRRITKLNYQTA